MKKSTKKYTLPAVLITAIILLGGVAVMTGGVKAGGSDVSFWDKVAQYTAQIIGGKVDVPVLEDMTFGAAAGVNHSFHEFFDGGLTVGGSIFATSTTNTNQIVYTTEATSTFRGTPTVIKWTPSINMTLKIDGTSTLPYVPNVGDVATVYFQNASSSAYVHQPEITFAVKDTTVDLQDNEDSGDLILQGLDWMKITFIHKNTYSFTAILDEFTEAD